MGRGFRFAALNSPRAKIPPCLEPSNNSSRHGRMGRKPIAGWTLFRAFQSARERTRTFTSLLTLEPESSASTNSATRAGALRRAENSMGARHLQP